MPTWTGAVSSSWNNAANWAADGTGSGIPTTGTDAVFSSTSSVQCNVDTASAVCRNLLFNGGTGFAGTINMQNGITVGAGNTAGANQSVTLSQASAGFNVIGSGGITVRANGTTTLTSNGKTWPNNLSLSTIQVTTISTVTLVDSWTIGGRLTIGDGVRQVNMNGAFNINVLGGLSVNSAVSAGIGTTAGSVPTIVFSGSGSQTWTQTSVTSIGINININTSGTLTITNGCSYGGSNIVSTSTFSYTAGTVVTAGTFTFVVFQLAATNYTVNLNGSPSPSATTTSSTGVNFNVLTFTSPTVNNANNITLSSPLCAVDNFNIVSTSTAKNAVRLTGSFVYVNKDFTINGWLQSNTTTTFQLQGTGTWSENNTLTAGTSSFGLGNSTVVINTTGTITLGSYVGISSGTLIYTAGSFVLGSFGFRAAAATITGLGSAGIAVPNLVHTSLGALNTAGSTITINDTVALSIGTLNFDGFNVNQSHRYAGTIGWTCANFNYQHTALATSNPVFGLIATAGVVYTVTNSFIFRAYTSTGSAMVKSQGAATRAIFTLKFGASQDVFRMGATEIDSSAEQTVWSRKGVLTTTLNWNLWTFPTTRFSTSIS